MTWKRLLNPKDRRTKIPSRNIADNRPLLLLAKIKVAKKKKFVKSKTSIKNGKPISVSNNVTFPVGSINKTNNKRGTRLIKNRYKKGKNFFCARIVFKKTQKTKSV